MTDITIDGSLTDWISSERIDDGSVAGYQIYATSDATNFDFAIVAPTAIGANTTAWFNTDRNATTGYQIFGFAGGAEYKVVFDANGVPSLYTGDGLTLVAANLNYAYNADHTTVEFSVAKSAIGNPNAIDTLYTIENTAQTATFLPTSFSSTPFTVYNNTGIVPASDTRVAIVWSQTTANNYFSQTAYADLFMSVQDQAMQAGIKYDIIQESDLTNLATLAKYDALIFPSFRNVQSSQADAIANTLQQAEVQFHLGIIAGGEFMTNDQNGNALPGNSYSHMATLLDATRLTGGNSATFNVTATDPSSLVLHGYTNGEVVQQYSNVGWNTFTSVSNTGTTIATENINGTNYAAALATQTGGRNVVFSTEGIMTNSNMLHDAINYVVNGSNVSLSLHMTRDTGILATRVDMDQSQELTDVKPTDGSPGIYDKMVPIMTQLKQAYDFVASYYVNIGDGTNGTGTNWAVSLHYYKALIDLGGEIGTHSYTHPEDTNTLTAAQLQYQFQQSATVLSQQLSAYLGYAYTIAGAAVPGAPETLATSQAIMPYVNSYLTGGWTGVGSGYPNAFGYMTPSNTDKIYLAPNTVFDYTLVEFQHMTTAQASAAWAAEWQALTNHGDTPIVVWPIHDYGISAWDTTGTGAASPYSTQMYTDYIARAAQQGYEFVTLEDLAARMQAFNSSTVTTTVSGNTITATVAAGGANVGQFALDLSNQGSQIIQNVAGWYAYSSTSVFLPASGGTFTVTLGAAQDDVTHITSLPMRASLLTVIGDGTNLEFTLSGEGLVVIDLTNPAGHTVSVSGATVVSQVGDILTVDVGAAGFHDVTVKELGLPPVITSNGGGDSAALSIAENTTAVTTVTATDPASLPLTYAVSGTDAALFAINATTGVLTFKSAPNFEAPADAGKDNVYNVVVTASDGALSDSQALAITVTNVNEAPAITSNGGGATAAISIAENTTAVTTVVAVDPEGTAPIYSVSGTDAALFTINAATGALAFASAPNFEAPLDAGKNNVYDIVVTASDGTLSSSQAIAVTVTNVNEPPVITSNGGGDTAAISVAENTTAVTTVTSTDPEGTARTYSVSGTDAALFAINATTGALTFKSAPNYEAPLDAGHDNIYNVVVTASDGVLTDTQALAITVTNVNEAPTITSNGGAQNAKVSYAENGTAPVMTVTATDPDGTAPTFRITGTDAAAFTIDAVTGVLKFIAPPDYENPTDADHNNSYIVTVVATDGSLTDFQVLTVNVTNVVGITAKLGSGGGTLNGTGEEDTLTGGSGVDTLNGLGGNDTLIGNGGNDILNGGDGNDQLTGGAGADTLTGGAGADTFIFTAIGQSTPGALNHDVIMDFQPGVDRIDLSSIDADTTHGGNQTFAFLATPGASFTGPGQLAYHYEFIGGVEYTVVQGNVNANLNPDFEVALLGHLTLGSSSFIL